MFRKTPEELAEWHEARAAELMVRWEAAFAKANYFDAKKFGFERAIHFETAKALRAQAA